MRPAVVAMLFAGAVAVGAVAGRQLMLAAPASLGLSFPLSEQPMRIRFLDPMRALARTGEHLAMGPHGTVDAIIPVRQTVEIPLRGRLAVQLSFEQRIPLTLDLDHMARVPVSTHADIEGSTRTAFGGIKMFRALGIRARIPLTFDLQVPVRIRHRGSAWIRYSGPATLAVDHRLQVPLDERLRVRLVLDQRITPELAGSIALSMQPAAETTAIVVTDAQLQSRARLRRH